MEHLTHLQPSSACERASGAHVWPCAAPIGAAQTPTPPQGPEPSFGRKRHQPRRRLGWAVAAAASLVIHAGLLLTTRWLPQPSRPPESASLQVFSMTAPPTALSLPADDPPPQAPAAMSRTASTKDHAEAASGQPQPTPRRAPTPQPIESAAAPASRATAAPAAPAAAASRPLGTEDASAPAARRATGRPSAVPTTPRAHALAEQLAAPPVPEPKARPAPAKTAARPAADSVAAQAPSTAEPTLPGLVALDAEIAAERRRAEQAAKQSAAHPTPARADAERSGLAALDAEIAASRAQARGGRADSDANPRADQHGQPRHGRSAGARASSADPAARGRAERRYLAALQQALARERHYPPVARRRGLEGTAKVQFTIAADGRFSAIRVSRTAGAASLDDAATQTVRRLARFDPIPAAIDRESWTVRVPIVFRLN